MENQKIIKNKSAPKKILKRKKIKICFLTLEYPPDIGGVSKSAYKVANYLKKSGYDIDILKSSSEVKTFEECLNFDINNGIKVYKYPKNFFYAEKVIELIHIKNNYDIFHGFFLYSSFPCLKIIKEYKIPFITSIRGIDGNLWLKDKKKKNIIFEVLNYSTWITSISTESFREISKYLHIANRSSFIPNSIQIDKKVNKWNLNDSNRGVIGTIATFRKKKNIPLLIESYGKLKKKLRKKLLLVGDFIENKIKSKTNEKIAKKVIEKYKLNEEVEITGYLENKQAVKKLKSMHIFVLSSNSEGLPNSLLEAASYGLPIVATKTDGVKDILTNGKNALLVPRRNSKKMVKAIERILTSDIFANYLSKNALKLAKKMSMKHEKKLWLKVYKKVLKNYYILKNKLK
ncbi:MAG: glycosyltransferase family 4 protein [Spirochaetes bacterium]|nr:glycosyltransferase family 4 protein [Spirochaetota bacterium]